ncbi:hypothetical protein BHM03_00047239 [Ensete ventricosum]|nr:hypothetical protein BHM03_00047239 [Ensete ventricosum]
MEKEEGFMDMLGSEEGKDHLFSPPSCLSSPSSSSSCYSSTTSAQLLWFGGKEEDDVAVLYGVPRLSTDTPLSSPSSSPRSTTISTSKSPNKVSLTSSAYLYLKDNNRFCDMHPFYRSPRRKREEGEEQQVIMWQLTTVSVRRAGEERQVRGKNHGTAAAGLSIRQGPRSDFTLWTWQSDTASVLHEALGYIRFLHDQVQVCACS